MEAKEGGSKEGGQEAPFMAHTGPEFLAVSFVVFRLRGSRR
jgi:hypothetical protein